MRECENPRTVLTCLPVSQVPVKEEPHPLCVCWGGRGGRVMSCHHPPCEGKLAGFPLTTPPFSSIKSLGNADRCVSPPGVPYAWRVSTSYNRTWTILKVHGQPGNSPCGHSVQRALRGRTHVVPPQKSKLKAVGWPYKYVE